MKGTLFIVRPFGNNRPVIKNDKDGNPGIVFFDFEKVETDLILPAMRAVGLQGGTTQKIFEAGEIKEDMFSELLLADIVIADITIHNANVFYELGIRHALRCKTTVLIKCRGFDETPFDIIGYRYIDYDKDNPGAALNTLINFLKNSPSSIKNDSPVFNMLPKLEQPETEKFLAVPSDFTEEVSIASGSNQIGKLALLAHEASFFTWEKPALRFIGEELFKLKAIEAGQAIWEKILEEYPDDFQANDRLATIYQRLAETEMTSNTADVLALLTASDLAIESLLNNHPEVEKSKRAEAYALKGRNAKTKWLNTWKNSGADKTVTALQSIFLETAYENYKNGFYEDLNHFYSGINALGLLTVITELAEQNSDAWLSGFSTDEEGNENLERKKTELQELASAVQLAIDAEKKRLEAQNKTDTWLNITEADFVNLTGKKPARAAAMYKKALENGQDFHREAVLKQLKIYKELNVLPDNVQAVLNVLAPAEGLSETNNMHYILFTGHMIDKPGRKEPRFPSEKEAAVREKIREKVLEEKNKINGPVTGIAGSACGGDILFHEVCDELGIKTQLLLALPADKFKTESVAFAGTAWIERFDSLYHKLPHQTLCDTKELPVWLQKKNDYTIWERNNLWELHSALVNGGMKMSLIALWDGQGGDGAGGTEHMVKQANERGGKVMVIDMKET